MGAYLLFFLLCPSTTPAGPDPDNATWQVVLQGFFPPGKKGERRNLRLYLARRNGKWTHGLGSEPTWNQTTYTLDHRGLSNEKGVVRGTIKVILHPDPWIPKDQKPISCSIEMDAALDLADPGRDGALRGTYKGNFGAEPVSGTVGGKVYDMPLVDENNCRVVVILNNALVGGKEHYHNRLALKIDYHDGKVASSEFGLVGLDNRPYDFRPFSGIDLKLLRDGIYGEAVVPFEVLGELGDPSATYKFSLRGHRVNNLVGGTFTVRVQYGGREIVKDGSFKGNVTEAVRAEPSIWEKDLKSDAPWYLPVSAHEPLKQGEHPRLFFRRKDLPELRRRAETPEGKAILARLRRTLGGGEDMPAHYNAAKVAYDKNASKNLPEGAYTVSHAAGFGLLYQLTGDRKYADLGRRCFEKAWEGVRDRDDRYSWRAPGGQLRAGPTLAWYALGYDLCYDGWEEDFRRKAALAIQDYDDSEGGEWGVPQGISLRQLCLTPAHMPASNHWGSQLGAGLAVLAILGDPGTDDVKLRSYLAAVEKNAVRAVTAGFGDGGFFAEGPGPSHMGANTALVPLFQAFKVALGKDYINARPNAAWLTLRWIMELLPSRGGPIYPCRKPSSYGSERFLAGNGGMSHGGWFSQGFGAIPDAHKPALLWIYRNFCAAADQNGFDTLNYPHRAVLALVNWPIGIEPRNPAETMPKTSVDKIHGYYVFRNQWKDETDVVVTAWLSSGPTGHISLGSPGVMVWGRGERIRLGSFPRCQTSLYEARPDGSGAVSGGGCSLAVDFRGDSALVAFSAPATEKLEGGIAAGGRLWKIATLPKDPATEIKMEGDRIRVGSRILSHDGKKILMEE